MALHDLGEFFGKLALEKLQGTNTPSQMQKQSSVPALFLEVEKPSQDEWGGARDALEAALLIEKKLKQPFWCGLFSACADPCFCRFLKVYFLDKVVKVIRKMSDHLTNLRGPTGPQAGRVSMSPAGRQQPLRSDPPPPPVPGLLPEASLCSHCCPVTQSCLTLGDPMDSSTPDFPVHCLPEFAQTHVH